MTTSPTKRRLLFVGGGLALVAVVLVALVIGLRTVLVGLAVGSVLRGAGATAVSYRVEQVTPWHIEVADIGFQLGPERLAIKRLTLTRTHWWTASLGTLAIEQFIAPFDVGQLGATKRPPPVEPSPAAPPPLPTLPLEGISLDGQVVVKADGLPAQTLELRFDAKPAQPKLWSGNVALNGPGVALTADATCDLAKADVEFNAPEFSVDLKAWQGFLGRMMSVPADGWDLAGKFTGNARGRVTGGKIAASGSVHLREGRAEQAKPAVVAEGIEADLEFTDVGGFVTKPGTLRIRELRPGKLVLANLDFEFAFDGPDRIRVTRGSLQTLGGNVSAEPFGYAPSKSDLDAVLLVDGIDIEQVMALTKDLPAKASGRVSGRFPVRIDRNGLQLGTGWLGLMPGVSAQIQFNAKGLLTGGMSANSPSYAVLEKVESGLLKLKVSELRLDIRPPNSPPGRSAQLHVAGEPVDPTVKAPVTLDLNVNGPLEKLLNMGMDSRLSFGPK